MNLDDLTPRQKEIAVMVGRGWSYAVIAGALHNLRQRAHGDRVSPRTVLLHVREVARKLPSSVEGSTPYRRVMRWVLDQQKAA